MPNHLSKSDIIEINGAQLFYEITGQGHPLLLIHAGVADSRMWDDQVEAFARQYRVIRFDLRGFGRSNLPPGVFSNVEDVRELLRAFDVEETYLLGISFGGLIALDFTLTYPEMVKGLILGAPSVSGSEPSERIKQFWAEEEALLDKDDLEAATDLNVRLWVDGPYRSPEQVNPAVRERVREMQFKAFRIPVPDDIEEESLSPPASERLGEVQAPTLLIVGDLDLEEKVAQIDQLATEMPNAQKAVISGVAHMPNMEAPEQFNRIVLDFLAALSETVEVSPPTTEYRLRPQGTWTYDDWLNFPEDRWKYEIIDGELYMTPPPGTGHQRSSVRLTTKMYNFVIENDFGEILEAPCAVHLPNQPVLLEPDIFFIKKERLHIIKEKEVEGAPDIIVEILSPSNFQYDRTKKFEVYQAAGVSEYWLVNYWEKTVEVFVLQEGAYTLLGKFEMGDTVSSEQLPGFQIAVATIFDF